MYLRSLDVHELQFQNKLSLKHVVMTFYNGYKQLSHNAK